MNKKLLSASIGALVLGLQVGTPAYANSDDVVEELINKLLLLDCHLRDNELALLLQLLEDNDDLLEFLEAWLPDCLVEFRGGRHQEARLTLADFGSDDDDDDGGRHNGGGGGQGSGASEQY